MGGEGEKNVALLTVAEVEAGSLWKHNPANTRSRDVPSDVMAMSEGEQLRWANDQLALFFVCKLMDLVNGANAGTVVITIDEHHGVLTQMKPTYATILAVHRALARAPWWIARRANERRRAYDVLVVCASATPEALPVGVPKLRSVRNKELFYMGRDFNPNTTRNTPDLVAGIDKEVQKARDRFKAQPTGEQEASARGSLEWQRGTGKHGEDAILRPPSVILADPEGGDFQRRIELNRLMQASLLGKTSCKDHIFEVPGSVQDRRSIRYAPTLPQKKTRESDMYHHMSPKSIVNVVSGFNAMVDAISFIGGRYNTKSPPTYNALDPQRIPMRRVKRVWSSSGPVTEDVDHYHSVLVVLAATKNVDLEPLRGECATCNNRPGARTTVFDLTDCPEDALRYKFQNDIRRTIRRNEKQVYTIVMLSQLPGVNCFDRDVDTVVLLGPATKNELDQVYGRVGRCPEPDLEAITPKKGEYTLVTLCSPLVAKLNRPPTRGYSVAEWESYCGTKDIKDEAGEAATREAYMLGAAKIIDGGGEEDEEDEEDEAVVSKLGLSKDMESFRRYMLYDNKGVKGVEESLAGIQDGRYPISVMHHLMKDYVKMCTEKREYLNLEKNCDGAKDRIRSIDCAWTKRLGDFLLWCLDNRTAVTTTATTTSPASATVGSPVVSQPGPSSTALDYEMDEYDNSGDDGAGVLTMMEA